MSTAAASQLSRMESPLLDLVSPSRDSSSSSPNLKRDHDSIEDLLDLEKPFSVPPFFGDSQAPDTQFKSPQKDEPSPFMNGTRQRDPSPVGSTTSSLTELRSATPSLRNVSPIPTSNGTPPGPTAPSAFAALNGNSQPPPKKVKLTFQEKELKRMNKEIKDREKAEERVKREAEKTATAEEKARKDAERDEERSKKESEKEAKRKSQEAERAEKEEKKRKREEEKAKSEEEKKRKEEEKKKKESSQMKLRNFFTIPQPSKAIKDRSMSPLPNPQGAAVASPTATTPKKSERTPYDKLFPAFFVQNNVMLAPINRFERDEDATESIQHAIDNYIVGERSPGRQRSFDATTLFHLSPHDILLRGKCHTPVREIMAELIGKPTRPIDLTTDSQNSQIKRTGELLKKVPLKFMKFQEDIRPPYRGTYTSRPSCGTRKLARRPMTRSLTTTDYDYDSEAEWVEDEDAEDLNSEGEEDDEGPEDGEDMEGFLDDEGDEMISSKRMVLQGDLEPISTGLCWEDRKKRNTNVKMMRYRMEVIIDPSVKCIDPFSTEYWKPPPASTTSMNPPRFPLSAMKTTASNVNGLSAPNSFLAPASFTDAMKGSNSSNAKHSTSSTTSPFTNSHFAVVIPSMKRQESPARKATKSTKSSSSSAAATTTSAKDDKLLPPEDLETFKAEIIGSNLSKVGLIEVLKKKFPGRTGAVIKKTLEVVAKRAGGKEVDKRWVLLEGESPSGVDCSDGIE